MSPDWELNQQPFGSQASTQPTKPNQPGVVIEILLTIFPMLDPDDYFYNWHFFGICKLKSYFSITVNINIILYYFQVYSIVVRQLYTLQSVPPEISGIHLSAYIVIISTPLLPGNL